MDGPQFDRLTRTLSSRRTALGGLLAGLTLLPLEASARKKGKDRKRKGKDKQRVSAQDSCWRAGACIPRKGSNVSQCNLSGYSPATTLDCTGCNISRANLRGANLSGANLTRANLSGSCLVDANLSGATVTNATNLYNAIFCRTTMPDGSVNNSGCGSATACCPNCIGNGDCPLGQTCCNGQCQAGCCPATCQSLNACGPNVSDGCGGTLSCLCGLTSTPTCNNGTCTTCSAVCTNGCACANLTDGTTLCTGIVASGCPRLCTTNAECRTGEVCLSTITDSVTGENFTFCETTTGVCATVGPCNR